MLQVCQRHLRPVTNRFGISGTAAIARAAAETLTATHWPRPPWKCKEPGDWNLLLSKIPWNVIHLQLWKVPILLCWKSTKNKIRALISHLGIHKCIQLYNRIFGASLCTCAKMAEGRTGLSKWCQVPDVEKIVRLLGCNRGEEQRQGS